MLVIPDESAGIRNGLGASRRASGSLLSTPGPGLRNRIAGDGNDRSLPEGRRFSAHPLIGILLRGVRTPALLVLFEEGIRILLESF